MKKRCSQRQHGKRKSNRQDGRHRETVRGRVETRGDERGKDGVTDDEIKVDKCFCPIYLGFMRCIVSLVLRWSGVLCLSLRALIERISG